MRIDELLYQESAKEDILPGLKRGAIGTIKVGESLNKNLIGLSLAVFLSGGKKDLMKLWSKKEVTPVKVLYLSIGDTIDSLSRMLRLVISNESKQTVKKLIDNLRLSIVSPELAPYRMKNQFFSAYCSDESKPDVIILNACNYIEAKRNTYDFVAPFEIALWDLATETNISIVVLKKNSEDKCLEKGPVSWTKNFVKKESKTGDTHYCLIEDSNVCNYGFWIKDGCIGKLQKKTKKDDVLSEDDLDSLQKTFMDESLDAEENSDKNKKEDEKKPDKHESTLTHVFLKDANEYKEKEAGRHEFDRIMAAISPGEGLPLATFDKDGKTLDRIQKELEEDFPWLSQITRWILQTMRGRIHFARGPVVFSIPPLLLVGPPGIGKTEWASSFAEKVGIPFESFGFGSTASGVEYISSVGRWWRYPKASRLLSFVAEYQIANPLILLDEIDKARKDDNYGTPQQALLGYLDRNASNLYDDFMEGHLDVTKLNLIATANELSMIDDALQSRFEVIETPSPLPDHARTILNRMQKRFAGEMGADPEMVPISNPLVKAVEDDLYGKKDLRSVWTNVKTLLLKDITGVDIDMKTLEKPKCGFLTRKD